MKHFCIHGHFYQPPRENPWLEEIELQESAYPYHDWNERITAECYAPNSASRILDSEKRITQIVNNYSKISFNFGPTLLSWLEQYSPVAYRYILEADQEGQKNFSGHGSAIAQAYNHIIMPLANSHDKRTQVIWGIKDFEYRFKRRPEGMWLSETAVDIESLEIMAEQGIKFTILAPHQASRVRKIGEKKWKDVSGQKIDPKRPYMCQLPSGRKMAIFFYDGPISRDIAFGDLLRSGENLAQRMLGTLPEKSEENVMVHIATDGETYGHHHHYGEMALSYCLLYIETNALAKITIYGEFLEKNPPTYEVEIFENTSWSCAHGIQRWNSDCGCCSGSNPNWKQQWRTPLRKGLNWIRDTIIPLYEREMRHFAEDPWAVRNEYIKVVLDRSVPNMEKFFDEHTRAGLLHEQKIKCLKLLEMQRHAMLMFTSCGWFFDEISGIETTQILRYALRVMQLAKELFNEDLEPNFLRVLEDAPSNIPEIGNGALWFEKSVKPSLTDLARVGAHYAVSSLFESYSNDVKIYSYTVNSKNYERLESGKQRLALGRIPIRSNITWEESVISFAVLHLGDHNLLGGVKEGLDDKTYGKIQQDIKDSFRKGDVAATINLIENYYEKGIYSLWHLFRDEQSKILYQILDSTLAEVEASLRQVNEYHYPIIQVIKQLHIPLPKVLANTVLVMLNKDILEVISDDNPNFERLGQLVSEVREWSLEIDKVTIGYVIRRRIHALMNSFSENPQDISPAKTVETLLKVLDPLSINPDLWRAQNIYFRVGQEHFKRMKEKASQNDETAKEWVNHFMKLGNVLRVKVA